MTQDTCRQSKMRVSIPAWSCSFSLSRCLIFRLTNIYIRAVRQKKAPSAGVWTPCLTDWTTESFLSLKPRSTGYVRQKSQRNDLWFSFAILLIGGDTVTVNDAAANGMRILPLIPLTMVLIL